jgi:AI-2 transport protein TqsA
MTHAERPTEPHPRRRWWWRDSGTLFTVAACSVTAASLYYLLDRLAGLLRPFLLAVLIAYVLRPLHHRLKRTVPTAVSLALMAGGSVLVIVVLATAVYANAQDLLGDLPGLIRRGRTVADEVIKYLIERAPWLVGDVSNSEQAERLLLVNLRSIAGAAANGAADTFAEAVIVGLYLLFLMLEADRFPGRIGKAYPAERAASILEVAGRVNTAVSTYLKAKVEASLVLAVPVTLILWLGGVKFALFWGLITFLGNFIPYIGSVVACTLPILFAFLQLDPWWRPSLVSGLLIGVHLLTSSVIEPAMLGRAVGLSPLVVVAALAFWGSVWGLPGMLLAVPLTVVAKIVLENVAFTRPAAMMLGEE